MNILIWLIAAACCAAASSISCYLICSVLGVRTIQSEYERVGGAALAFYVVATPLLAAMVTFGAAAFAKLAKLDAAKCKQRRIAGLIILATLAATSLSVSVLSLFDKGVAGFDFRRVFLAVPFLFPLVFGASIGGCALIATKAMVPKSY